MAPQHRPTSYWLGETLKVAYMSTYSTNPNLTVYSDMKAKFYLQCNMQNGNVFLYLNWHFPIHVQHLVQNENYII